MKDNLKKILIILFWIVVWGVIALIIANPIVLAGPQEVVESLILNCNNTTFWLIVGFSLLRVIIAFCIAFILGFGFAYFAYKFKIIKDFLEPLIQFLKSAPIVCVVVLLLIWFGVHYVDIAAVVLAVIPIVYYATYQAFVNKDQQITNMLNVHQVKKSVIFAVFEIPSLMPYIKQAIQSGIGIAWKSGVTAQMIGAVGLTIGQGVYSTKLNLDSAGLLCWMFVVIILSFICEKAFIALINLLYKTVRNYHLNNFKSNLRVSKNSTTNLNDNISHPQDEDAQCLVKFSKVNKSFDKTSVLHDYNFCIKKGQRVVFNQESGFGKTTIINIILGIVKPDSGEVTATKNVSVCFQSCTLLNSLSVKDNIQVVSNIKIDKPTLVNGMPEELSGGMKRLAEIERALTCESDLVILDEPFAGLDIKTKNKAKEYIENNLRGRALILITHD